MIIVLRSSGNLTAASRAEGKLDVTKTIDGANTKVLKGDYLNTSYMSIVCRPSSSSSAVVVRRGYTDGDPGGGAAAEKRGGGRRKGGRGGKGG